jgi:hypothetical protein
MPKKPKPKPKSLTLAAPQVPEAAKTPAILIVDPARGVGPRIAKDFVANPRIPSGALLIGLSVQTGTDFAL